MKTKNNQASEPKKYYLCYGSYFEEKKLIMDNIAVSRLMRLINGLSIESKLEILSKLSENLKKNFNSENNTKEILLDDLFGSWNDTNENLSNDILESRTNLN